MDRDLESIQQARSLLDKASQAQARLSQFSQDQVDSVVQHMAEAGLGAAEKLARMAVEETGFGNVADKILKNKFGSEFVHEAIKALRTVGIIREDRKKGILEIASPVGVIAAIIPSTNPTSTTINKALIALKGRNTIVFSPHPSAAGCIRETSRILSEAAVVAGAPEGSIGCLSHSTLEGTRELMSHRNTALILSKPAHGPALYWHQDGMVWNHPKSGLPWPTKIFLSYYMVDTTPHNGCLRVISGSHRNRHRMHDVVHTAHTDELRRATDPNHPAYQPMPEDQAVPVRAGDLVIGDSRLLHGSYANRTDERRTVITIWYHPNFDISSPRIQANLSRTQTRVVDWPQQAQKLVQRLVPTYEGDEEPLEWNRVPGPELK